MIRRLLALFLCAALQLGMVFVQPPVSTTITGTADQVTVTAASGAVTLSLPQSIATTSTPTFKELTLTGTLALGSISVTGTPTWSSAQTFPGLTLSDTLAMAGNGITFTDTSLRRDAAGVLGLWNAAGTGEGYLRVHADATKYLQFRHNGSFGYLYETGSGLLRLEAGAAIDLHSSGYLAPSVDVEVNLGTDGLRWGIAYLRTYTTQGTSGAAFSTKSATTTVNTTNLAATITASNLIPAGSVVYAVVTRNIAAFNGTMTSFSIGDGATANLFANNTALGLDETTDLTDHLATFKPTLYTSATSVVVTATGGTFGTTGTIRITVFYYDSTAPTS